MSFADRAERVTGASLKLQDRCRVWSGSRRRPQNRLYLALWGKCPTHPGGYHPVRDSTLREIARSRPVPRRMLRHHAVLAPWMPSWRWVIENDRRDSSNFFIGGRVGLGIRQASEPWALAHMIRKQLWPNVGWKFIVAAAVALA